MRRRVPPGGISQLTTDTDLLFPATWKSPMFTFLTVPRAHSRIHRIAKLTDCHACLFTTSGSVVFLAFSHDQENENYE